MLCNKQVVFLLYFSKDNYYFLFINELNYSNNTSTYKRFIQEKVYPNKEAVNTNSNGLHTSTFYTIIPY